jgi:hypothetical protein
MSVSADRQMSIGRENLRATEQRLRQVLAAAAFVVCQGTYAFEEFAAKDFAKRANRRALALIRDGAKWSQLVPCPSAHADALTVFQFHFSRTYNTTGFVGWLATRLRRRCGTGAIVICGQNRRRGGIFDYWAVRASVGDAVVREIKALRGRRRSR